MSDESESLEFPNAPFYSFNITVGLTLSLTKLCASKCRLFKPDLGVKLNENDVQCICKNKCQQNKKENCAAAINNNYSTFSNQIKESINFEDSLGAFEPEE